MNTQSFDDLANNIWLVAIERQFVHMYVARPVFEVNV